MTYDKLTDQLDKKLLDIQFKAFALFAALLLKPLSTATDPFFRKNLGERRFSWSSIYFGFFLWLLSSLVSNLVGPVGADLTGYVGLQRLAVWIRAHDYSRSLGGIIGGVFFVLGCMNIAATRLRQQNGAVWHSMSRGESRFGREDYWRDIRISVLAAVCLFALATPVGLLFVLSRFLSYFLEAKEQQSVYARYLDAMDAKLEAQHLEIALRDGVPPKTTEGIYGPLPKRFTGEHRANVARAGAGAAVRIAMLEDQVAAAPASIPAGPRTQQVPFSPAPVQPVPQQPQSVPPSAPLRISGRTVLLLLGGLFLVAAAWRGKQMWTESRQDRLLAKVDGDSGSTTARRSPPVTVPKPVAAPVPTPKILAKNPSPSPAPQPVTVAATAPVATSTPPPVAVSNALSPAASEPAPEAHPAIEPLVAKAEAPPVQTSPPPAKPVEQPVVAAVAEAKPDPPAAPKPAEKSPEEIQREELVKKVDEFFAAELDLIHNFQTNCDLKLAANAEKIDKLSRSRKRALTHENDAIRKVATDMANRQLSLFAQAEEKLPPIKTGPLSGIERLLGNLPRARESSIDQRQQILTMLDAVAAKAN